MKKKRKLNILPKLLIILILTLILTIILMMPIPKKNISGNVILSPTIPTDCSNESIKSLWDSIFLESSNNISIITNTSESGKCNSYILYKFKNNFIYVLGGTDINSTKIIALRANATEEYINTIRNKINFPSDFDSSLWVSWSFNPDTQLYPRSLNIEPAKSEFNQIFKETSDNWTIMSDSERLIYTSNKSEIISNIQYQEHGIIMANHTIDWFTYVKFTIPSCTSNWIPHNTSCNSSEILYTWYTDSNNCPNPTIPDNISTICDYNNDSLIGTIDSFTTKTTSSGFTNLSVYINNILANNTASLNLKNKIERVEFKDPTTTYVEFYWDFSTPLDLTTISIEKQSSSEKGYILVKGLNVNKSITLNNLANTNMVCVKDSEISSISSINESCYKQNEHVLSCPASFEKISCEIVEGGNFRIYGLTHSGAIEFVQNITPCIPSWNCSDWFECKNNTQTKICKDLNRCGLSTGKPIVNQSCGTNLNQSNCIVSLNCTEWSKCQNSTQIRACSDINKCQENKNETRECEKPDSTKSIIFISIISVLVILIIIVILFIILEYTKKNRRKYI